MTQHKPETQKILFWVWLLALLPIFVYITGAAGFINDLIGSSFFNAKTSDIVDMTNGVKDLKTVFEDNVLTQVLPYENPILLPLSGTIVNDAIINFLQVIETFFYDPNLFKNAFLNTNTTFNDVITVIFFRLIPSIIVVYMILLLLFAPSKFFSGPGNFSSFKAMIYESMLFKMIIFLAYFSFFIGEKNGGITLVTIEKVKENLNGSGEKIPYMKEDTNGNTKEVKVVFKILTEEQMEKYQSEKDSYKVPNIIYYLFKFITRLAFSLDGSVLPKKDNNGNFGTPTAYKMTTGPYTSGDTYYPIFTDFWNEWVYNNYIDNSIDLSKNPVQISNNFIINLLLENKKEEMETIKLQCLIKRKILIENNAFLETKYIPNNEKLFMKIIVDTGMGEIIDNGVSIKSTNGVNETNTSFLTEKNTAEFQTCNENPFYLNELLEQSPIQMNARTRNYICYNPRSKSESILTSKITYGKDYLTRQEVKKIEIEVLKRKMRELKDPTILTDGYSIYDTYKAVLTKRYNTIILRSGLQAEDFLDLYDDRLISIDEHRNHRYLENGYSKTMVATLNVMFENYENDFTRENTLHKIQTLISNSTTSDGGSRNYYLPITTPEANGNFKHLLNQYLTNAFGKLLSEEWVYLNKLSQTIAEEEYVQDFDVIGNRLIPTYYFNLAFGFPYEIFSNKEKEYGNYSRYKGEYQISTPITKILEDMSTEEITSNLKEETVAVTNQNFLTNMLVKDLKTVKETLNNVLINTTFNDYLKVNNKISFGSSTSKPTVINRLYGQDSNIDKADLNYINNVINGDSLDILDKNKSQNTYLYSIFLPKYNENQTMEEEKDICGNNINISDTNQYKGAYSFGGNAWANRITNDGIEINLSSGVANSIEKDFCNEYNTSPTSEYQVFHDSFKNSAEELKASLSSYDYIGNFISPYLDLLLYKVEVEDKERDFEINLNMDKTYIDNANYTNVKAQSIQNKSTRLFIEKISEDFKTKQQQTPVSNTYYNLRSSNVFFLPKDVSNKIIYMGNSNIEYEKLKVESLINRISQDKYGNEIIELLSEYKSFLDKGYINNLKIKLNTFEGLLSYINLINKLRVYIEKIVPKELEQEIKRIKDYLVKTYPDSDPKSAILRKTGLMVQLKKLKENKLNLLNGTIILGKVLSLQIAKYKDFYYKYKNYEKAKTLPQFLILSKEGYLNDYFYLLSSNQNDNGIGTLFKYLSNNTHFKITDFNDKVNSNENQTMNTSEELYKVIGNSVNTGLLFDNIKQTEGNIEDLVQKQSTNYKEYILPEIKKQLIANENSNKTKTINTKIEENVEILKLKFKELLKDTAVEDKISDILSSMVNIEENTGEEKGFLSKIGSAMIGTVKEGAVGVTVASGKVAEYMGIGIDKLFDFGKSEEIEKAAKESSLLLSILLNEGLSYIEKMVKEMFIFEKKEEKIETVNLPNITNYSDIKIPKGKDLSQLGVYDWNEDIDDRLEKIDEIIKKIKIETNKTMIDVLKDGLEEKNVCSIQTMNSSFYDSNKELFEAIQKKIIIYTVLSIGERLVDLIEQFVPMAGIKVTLALKTSKTIMYFLKYIIIWQLILIVVLSILLILLLINTIVQMWLFIIRYILAPLLLLIKTILEVIKKLLFDYVKEVIILVYKIIISLANPEHISREVEKIENDILNIKTLLDFIGEKTLTIVISILTLMFAIFIYYLSSIFIGIGSSYLLFDLIITKNVISSWYSLPFFVVISYFLVFKIMNMLYGVLKVYINRDKGKK